MEDLLIWGRLVMVNIRRREVKFEGNINVRNKFRFLRLCNCEEKVKNYDMEDIGFLENFFGCFGDICFC